MAKKKAGIVKKTGLNIEPVETLTKVIILIAIIGIFVSLYLVNLHYKTDGSSFCNINEKLNCDVVNKSIYSEFLGIPVAIIGFLGYLSFIVVGVAFLAGYDWSIFHPKLRPKHLNMLLMLFGILGFLFSLYLAYIEEFVLHTWCIMCVASLILITAIMVLSIISYVHCARCRKIKKGVDSGKACRYC